MEVEEGDDDDDDDDVDDASRRMTTGEPFSRDVDPPPPLLT
jgi:hypothetical protein